MVWPLYLSAILYPRTICNANYPNLEYYSSIYGRFKNRLSYFIWTMNPFENQQKLFLQHLSMWRKTEIDHQFRFCASSKTLKAEKYWTNPGICWDLGSMGFYRSPLPLIKVVNGNELYKHLHLCKKRFHWCLYYIVFYLKWKDLFC